MGDGRTDAYHHHPKVPLGDFARSHLALSREEFLHAITVPVLIVTLLDDQAEATASFSTRTGRELRLALTDRLLEGRVCRVEKRRDNAFRSMISLGRTTTNDIPIDTPTISKLHAIFQCRGEAWTLMDCGSSNGTFMDDDRLPPKVATPIDPGTELFFSTSCVARFLPPPTLYDYIQSLRPFLPRQ